MNPSNTLVYLESDPILLAMYLLQQYSSQPRLNPKHTSGLPKYKLTAALEYIEQHLGEDVSLSAIATHLDISYCYFSRLFKQSMGIGVRQYIIQQRIEYAKELLKQHELSISDIAFQTGCGDQSHFTKLFRECTGVTPKVYRNLLEQ